MSVPPTPESSHENAISGGEIDFKNITRLCRRGLPILYRPTYWKIIMGFYPLTRRSWNTVEERSVREYDKIAMSLSTSDADGVFTFTDDLLKVIDLDIARTMPDVPFFSDPGTTVTVGTSKTVTFTVSQHYLRRVIYLIARVNKGIGYVQGMNEFVALLLYAFSQGSTARLDRRVEADCFFCFQTLLGFLGDDFCRALDQDSDTGVHTTMRQFDNSLRLFDPEVLEHLCSLGVTSEHYALRWLLLLFIHELDLQHVLRIWDFLLSFGDELRSAAFFVAAAMCHNLRDTILASESISDVIPHLHRYPGDQMENVLRIAMRWILVCGLEIIPKIKNASEEEIGALRVKFNLDGKSPMTPNGTRKAGWFTRLFSS